MDSRTCQTSPASPAEPGGLSASLVRLSHVNRGMLRDLLGMAYKFVTRLPRQASRKTKRR